MERQQRAMRQQVARGVVLRSLEVCFPHEQGVVWMEAALATEGLQLGEDFADVLHYLAAKGLIVAERDGDTIVRARLHQRGLDVAQGLVEATGIRIQGSIHPDIPVRRGRLLECLEITFPHPGSIDVLRLQLERMGFLTLTNTAVLADLTYLQDLGLVECVESRVLDQSLRLWRLTAEGVDMVEAQGKLVGVDLTRRS